MNFAVWEGSLAIPWTMLADSWISNNHFLRFASLVLGQSYDCLRARQTTLKHIGKLTNILPHHTQQNANTVHRSCEVFYMIMAMYSKDTEASIVTSLHEIMAWAVTMTNLSYTVNIMGADDLMLQGARALAPTCLDSSHTLTGLIYSYVYSVVKCRFEKYRCLSQNFTATFCWWLTFSIILLHSETKCMSTIQLIKNRWKWYVYSWLWSL